MNTEMGILTYLWGVASQNTIIAFIVGITGPILLFIYREEIKSLRERRRKILEKIQQIQKIALNNINPPDSFSRSIGRDRIFRIMNDEDFKASKKLISAFEDLGVAPGDDPECWRNFARVSKQEAIPMRLRNLLPF